MDQLPVNFGASLESASNGIPDRRLLNEAVRNLVDLVWQAAASVSAIVEARLKTAPTPSSITVARMSKFGREAREMESATSSRWIDSSVVGK